MGGLLGLPKKLRPYRNIKSVQKVFIFLGVSDADDVSDVNGVNIRGASGLSQLIFKKPKPKPHLPVPFKNIYIYYEKPLYKTKQQWRPDSRYCFWRGSSRNRHLLLSEKA